MKTAAPNRVRFAAALAAADKTYGEIVSASGLSRRYLADVLAGNRSLSHRAEEALRGAVGPDGWRYAMGETDVLPTATKRAA